MDVWEARRLRQLEVGNAKPKPKPKHLLAEAHLDLHALRLSEETFGTAIRPHPTQVLV